MSIVRKGKTKASVAALAVLMLAGWGSASAQELPVAGERPDQRLAGAPVMAEPEGGEARLARLAFGVETPLPEGVLRLNVPGRWYTPFDHRGMTSPYDLRGWHRQAAGAPAKAAAPGNAK